MEKTGQEGGRGMRIENAVDDSRDINIGGNCLSE